MKRPGDVSFFGLIVVLCTLCGCGSSQPTSFTGPLLDVNQATSLIVDQFYANGGLDKAFSSQRQFAVYLRDASTGKDLACVGQNDGMKKLSTPGVYYGGLQVKFRELDGDHPNSSVRFQVVVVEKSGDDCPKPVGASDTIVGMSPEITFDQLLNKEIWTTNGVASVTLRPDGSEMGSVPAMAPAVMGGLVIDKIFVDNGDEGNTPQRYFIFAQHMNGDTVQMTCQVKDSFLTPLQYGHLIYSAMAIPIDCFAATDPAFATTVVKVSLWIQHSDGPAMLGETAAAKIGDIIGTKVPFTNGKGYFNFQDVVTKLFSTSVVRLAEVTTLKTTALTYNATPSFNPTVEMHIMTSNAEPYSLACEGDAQGLTGVATPGTYSTLSATFVPVTGQKELFGSDHVIVQLVNRLDGQKCPVPMSNAPQVLAVTSPLAPSDLAGGKLTFLTGGGSVNFTSNN